MRLLTPSSATASSVTGGNTAANAIDDNGETRWESEYSDPQYIYLDMGSVVKMSRLAVQWQGASSAEYTVRASVVGPGLGPPSFWEQAASVSYSTAGERLDIVDFFAIGRYLAINSTSRTNPALGNSIWEMKVYSDDVALPGSSMRPIGAVSSSLESVTGFPTAASCDSLTTTRWSSAFSDPQWVYWDFGEPVFMNSVSIMWEAASANTYDLQTSDDGVNWKTMASVAGNTVGARTDEFPTFGGIGRFLRMYGTVRNTPFGYSIFDVAVTGNPVGAALQVPATALGHLF